jgi:hypothetical protein
VASELDIAKTQLRVDWYTGQVARAMAGRALRPILLKGPAVSRWLYGDDLHSRPYADADILLSPTQRRDGEAVLADLGFERHAASWLRDEPPHAATWLRATDGALVDLHRTLHGCEHLAESLVWDAVAGATDTIDVGGVMVEVPSVKVRALHVALHAIPGWGEQAFADLARAIRLVDGEVWDGAAALARRLGVADEMGYRLAFLEDGRTLAGELGLSTASPLRVDDDTRALTRMMNLPGWRARARYGFQKLFPPPDYLAEVTDLRPGRLGLVLGYAARLGSAVRRVPTALVRLARTPRR